ncbi:hypothetical protein [Microtetraspora malaysiensis]|uniref:hypothetical protein n=1 Tax=Microtetraspora malaysiensis TaxID=161358 RepID=UPI003D89EDD3
MAEISYPFASGPGSIITQEQWSRMASAWQDNGVDAVPGGSDLRVSSSGEPNKLKAAPGHANIAGFHYHLDADAEIGFTSNTSSNPRMDLVVLRLDRAANRIYLTVKAGVASASPVAPSPDRSWQSPEVPLATILVPANSTTVTPSNVVDVREYRGSRIGVVNDPGSLPEGVIGYRPSDGSFYGMGKTGPIPVAGNTPTATVARSTTQPIADSAAVEISWSSANYQSHPIWSASQPTRLTVPSGWDGIYLVGANVEFASGSATGYRQIYIRTNGSAIRGRQTVPSVGSGTPTRIEYSRPLPLRGGDYVEITAFHTAGAATNLTVPGQGMPEAWLHYLRPMP